MRKYLGWLAIAAFAILFVIIKTTFFETAAEKKAANDRMAAKAEKLIRGLDKSGTFERADALISLTASFINNCKATVTPANPRATLSDDDKKQYCTCAGRGMIELYYGSLSKTEMIERSKAGDLGPSNIRHQVFVACNASLDAYNAPRSQP
jgi:hypothetical protein